MNQTRNVEVSRGRALPRTVALVLPLLYTGACGADSPAHTGGSVPERSNDAARAPEDHGGAGGGLGSGARVPVPPEHREPSGAGGVEAVGAGGSGGEPLGEIGGGPSRGGAGSTPGVEPPIFDASSKTRLRLLTQIEYENSVTQLLGMEVADVVAALYLPEDVPVKGFASVGAALVSVGDESAERYERSSLTLAIDVFSDPPRWQALVGCTPQPDLSDNCVDQHVRGFGRRAFRRELTDEETARWVGVARSLATRSELPDAATGLAGATAGILQSPHFLYRFESAIPDPSLGRIKFDGPSMATRLAYLATGTGPDDALLDAALAGELDTPEGLRMAVEQIFASPEAAAFMPEFFFELTEVRRVLSAEKDPRLFPQLDDALRASMLEEANHWLRSEVLAPGADVRSFFNGTRTFVDSRLAEFYGLPDPALPFEPVQLPSDSGRSGILGKAAFLMAQSAPSRTSPTRRGLYILRSFLCGDVAPPPDAVVTTVVRVPEDMPMTTRELMAQHLSDPTCVACHAAVDPLGYALEHFDASGRYRATEDGLPIDATGAYEGTTFDGAEELGQFLHDTEITSACLVSHLYRHAHGTSDVDTDAPEIAALTTALADGGYVWRDLLLHFAASDAFTSLPPTVP